jgi:hypothetical protein
MVGNERRTWHLYEFSSIIYENTYVSCLNNEGQLKNSIVILNRTTSQVLDELEVPRFHPLPIIEKPHSGIIPVEFSCKELEKAECLLSFALVHCTERGNRVAPTLTTEDKTRKQEASMLLCGKLARSSK